MECILGKVDITPKLPIILAGYREYRVSYDINDRLEVNFIIIKNDQDFSLILSFDLLYIGKDLKDLILQGLEQYLLTEENLLCAASHTHFAPATDSTLPYLGQVDDEYVSMVANKVVDAVKRSLKEGDFKTLKYRLKKGSFNELINRRLRQRQFSFPKFPYVIKFKPNRKGKIIDEINRVEFFNSSGNVECVMWSMSCHPVSFPNRNDISADYPGYIRSMIRKEYGVDIPVIFLQGAAGNIRPPAYKKPTDLFQNIKNFFMGPDFGVFTMKEWTRWCQSIWRSYQDSTLVSTGSGLNFEKKRVQIDLNELIDNNLKEKQINLQKIVIDNDIQIVAFSSEIMSEHLDILNSLALNKHNILVGYIDQVHGYWPTNKMVEEGGYEGDSHKELFSINGTFKKDLDKVFLNSLKKILAV